MQTLIVLLGLGWMFCSYYFIWQTNYYASENVIQNEDILRQPVVESSNDDNAYLQEQQDGSYLFYFRGHVLEVSAEEVETGLYDFYPIIEYEEETNIVEDIFGKIKRIVINMFS